MMRVTQRNQQQVQVYNNQGLSNRHGDLTDPLKLV
jgi:hypothetical protein